MQQSMNLQSKMTNLVFEIINQGNVDQLKIELSRLGFKNCQEVALLIDESVQSQNALFTSCVIKDPLKAYNMTKFLVEEAKCDAAHQDTLNQTCLFYVSRDGRMDLVKLFLENGCKANHSDCYDQSALFYAAREGHIEIMKLLIEAGGDPDFVDHEGQTPIFYVVK